MKSLLSVATCVFGVAVFASQALGGPGPKAPPDVNVTNLDPYQPWVGFPGHFNIAGSPETVSDVIHPGPVELHGFDIVGQLEIGVTECRLVVTRDAVDNPHGGFSQDGFFWHKFFQNEVIHHEFHKPILITDPNSMTFTIQAVGAGRCDVSIMFRLNAL
jgi:hypothetical protein